MGGEGVGPVFQGPPGVHGNEPGREVLSLSTLQPVEGAGRENIKAGRKWVH